MGKGNRNSQKRIEKQLANEEKILAKERAQQKKKVSDKAVAAACIVIALIVVAILAINILGETGVLLRVQPAMSQGDVVVNSAMMSFYVNDYIMNWYNTYYVYAQFGLISIDLASDFRNQIMNAQDASYMGDSSLAGTTWYDYFVNTAIENVEMYVTYANAAKAANITLSEEDKAEINETLKAMKDALKANGMTFADQYGKGVTEGDVRDCYELIYLASAYGEHMQDSFEAELKNEFSANKEENSLISYREDNKGSFYSAKYLSYTISINEKLYKGDQEKYDSKVADAKKVADKIAEAKTPAEFVELVELYKKSPTKFMVSTGLMEDTGKETDTEAKTEASTGKETGTEAQTTVEELMSKYEGSIYYETDSKLGDWIFGEKDPAEKNDTLVVTETGTEVVTEKVTTPKETGSESSDPQETETGAPKAGTEASTSNETETATGSTGSSTTQKVTYETFKVTVYMLLSTPALDETFTHDIAYLISDNKDAANAFLKEFKSSAAKNGDVFEEIAKKHYDKLFEGHDHSDHAEGEKDPVFSYAQAEHVKEKYFADDYNVLNEWIDDEVRVSGDLTDEVIEITVTSTDSQGKKTETKYYAVLFFENQNSSAWYIDALLGAVQQNIDDWYEAELAKKLITYNFKAINKIDLISFTANAH